MTAVMMICEHGTTAVCWLCSDQVSWWRAARIQAGLNIEPPNPCMAKAKTAWQRRQVRRVMFRRGVSAIAVGAWSK